MLFRKSKQNQKLNQEQAFSPNLGEKKVSDKIKIVSRFLQKKEVWFTGIPIKKHLGSNVFDREGGTTNNSIKAGRWSAYCHYSAVVSFANLLDKQEVFEGKKVLVHPLLPPEFIDVLKRRKVQIETFDIEKKDLNWNLQQFTQKIEELKDLDLIVFYGFNGLYSGITECVKVAQGNYVSSIVFIDNPNLNHDLLGLFDELTLGGVLWDYGESVVDNQLNVVLPKPLPSKRWFVSWHIETRTRSLMEYHLSDSQDVYKAILEAYFYLLVSYFKSKSFKNRLIGLGYKQVYASLKNFDSAEEAESVVIENYRQILNAAVPDVFFELHKETKEVAINNEDIDLAEQASLVQPRTKQLYDMLAQQVQIRPEGSLEIPELQMKQIYSEYFFYTTEKSYWREYFEERKIRTRVLVRVHEDFKLDQNLVNAQFVEGYLVAVNIQDCLEQSL